jgi:hypothetical protein
MKTEMRPHPLAEDDAVRSLPALTQASQLRIFHALVVSRKDSMAAERWQRRWTSLLPHCPFTSANIAGFIVSQCADALTVASIAPFLPTEDQRR